MKQTTYRLEGMDCPADESLVRTRLSDVEGVELVEVDLAARRITVSHDTDPSLLAVALDELDLGTREVSHAENVETVAGVSTPRERGPLLIALFMNAAFFVTELAAGIVSGSMGLVADSLDMLADAAVYALGLAAVGSHIRRKTALAATSGYLQFGLATFGLVEVVRRFVTDGDPPEVLTMLVVSALALCANTAVLLLLTRARSGEVHIEASWIFTSNDIKANAAVIAAAIAVWVTESPVPDLVAGAVIFVFVANGARRIIALARRPNSSTAC